MFNPMLAKGMENYIKCLAMGKLRCIGATTMENCSRYLEKDVAFEKRFQQVFLAEQSVADTISILRGLKKRYEGRHDLIRIQDRALVAAASAAPT